MPMRHSIDELAGEQTRFLYEWKMNGKWNCLGAAAGNTLSAMQPGSAEAFILEHYWGYNKISETKTYEYQVEHISWNAGQVTDPILEADVTRLYGSKFKPYLSVQPYSAFFADGSEVIVRAAGKILYPPALQVSSAL
ncbi:MAG: hypothetical protein JWP78_2437 [Mucilaginibacter sp.]|nr:hypothetical protein [Mucilaginibacter sp.]